MKKLILGLVMMVGAQMASASDLQLKCQNQMGRLVLNIQSLVAGNTCQSGDFQVNARTRYSIELCNGTDAEGVLEILDINNTWVEVEKFSTAKNCYLWRPIRTQFPTCRRSRHAHNGGRCQ